MRWRRRRATAPQDDRNATYDRQTIEVIGRVLGEGGGGVGVDVGAHEGAILAAMVEAAPAEVHHAFEPIPGLAARLRSCFPTVAVHEVALAAADGEAEFHHVVSNPGYSGLRRRRYDRPNEDVVLTTVRTARLDDELDRAVDVRLVKVDVEGGELGVFEGGRELLRRCQPFVVFEHGLGAADFYGTQPEDVYALLHDDVGLEVTLLVRWLGGQPALGGDEFADEFRTGRNYYFLAYPGSR